MILGLNDLRRGSRSQTIIHYSFHNYVEIVDDDGRSRYRSQTRPYPSHNSGEIGRSLGFYIHGRDKSGHRYHTIQFYSHNHGRIYIIHPRLPQESIPRGLQVRTPHQSYPYYSYPSMSPQPNTSMPPQNNQNRQPHPIPPCTYFNYTPMYEPYSVAHHPHIPYLGYLHRPPSILPSSML